MYDPTYGCTPGWGYGYAPYAYDYGYYAFLPYGGYGWQHDYHRDGHVKQSGRVLNEVPAREILELAA